MKIQTFSIVFGGTKCNASCPYCVSKMTGNDGVDNCKVEDINYRNFRKACHFSKQSGVSTVLLTGKGEPLLYHNLITQYLDILDEFNFPFIELQTNGIELPMMVEEQSRNRISINYTEHSLFKNWYEAGLTTICLSCVHWLNKDNKQIFGKNYGKNDYNLSDYIKICHDAGFSVRVSCVMAKGYIDNLGMVKNFIEWCNQKGVEQLTVRPVSMPDVCIDKKVEKWTYEHLIDPDTYADIESFFILSKDATLLLKLAHGAKVYDYFGQNVSINSCLTHNPNPDDMRQLIYFPDGHLRYDWTHKGAILV